ncbi:MAG: hypothetical protein EOO62_38900, partial [Hymenobacter sp.]
MHPAPNTSERKFYPPPQSWFSKHISPWLLFLFFSGLLLMGWLPGSHSVAVHSGFTLAEAVLILFLRIILTDTSITCLTIGPEQVTKEEVGTTTTLYYPDIKGFLEHSAASGTYTRLVALPHAGKDIVVEARYEDYQEIRA